MLLRGVVSPCKQNLNLYFRRMTLSFLTTSDTECLVDYLLLGVEAGASDRRVKRVASYVFHPFLPFAISVQQAFMQPNVVNFYFRK